MDFTPVNAPYVPPDEYPYEEIDHEGDITAIDRFEAENTFGAQEALRALDDSSRNWGPLFLIPVTSSQWTRQVVDAILGEFNNLNIPWQISYKNDLTRYVADFKYAYITYVHNFNLSPDLEQVWNHIRLKVLNDFYKFSLAV